MYRLNKISGRRLINLLLIFTFIISSSALKAQSDKKFIRQGNRAYEKANYPESEISYRKAVDKNKMSVDGVFNVGDALYKQNKYEDAVKQFSENIKLNEDKNKKSAGFYNLGNSLLKANKFNESIEAYKESLKLRPDNIEAKYNLAYAQDMLKQQQQQQKQDKDKQDQNKENKKDDQKNDQDKNKEQQKDQNNKQDEQQQQQQSISKEDAERLLNALANDEKNVQEKVKLEKAAKAKVRTIKNW